MKATVGLFGAGVAGVVVCLVMIIVTAVQDHRRETAPPTHPIAVPALTQ